MKLRVAFVTQYDATDRTSWSGTSFFISRALERQDVVVDLIGSLRRRAGPIPRVKEALHRRLRTGSYLLDRAPSVLRAYGREVDSRLPRNADLIFFPGSFPLLAFLRDRRPCVAYTDGSFHALHGFYPEYRTICRESVADALRAEEAALDRCAHLFFSSPWALDTAQQGYPFLAAKSTVVPFGANLDEPMGRDQMEGTLDRRGGATCRLLFVGRDWRRKRLPFVFEVMEALARRGIDAALDVVGVPDFPGLGPSFHVRDWGILDTSTAEGKGAYDALLRGSDFMILPSAAECFGICLCEAASRGLPCVASGVGGIPSVVRDGLSGFVLPPKAGPGDYAEAIATAFTDRVLYRGLAYGAFEDSTARLNWHAAMQIIVPRLWEIASS
jgi:glycosyltransferase involved in cell wall biosynthesis